MIGNFEAYVFIRWSWLIASRWMWTRAARRVEISALNNNNPWLSRWTIRRLARDCRSLSEARLAGCLHHFAKLSLLSSHAHQPSRGRKSPKSQIHLNYTCFIHYTTLSEYLYVPRLFGLFFVFLLYPGRAGVHVVPRTRVLHPRGAMSSR